MARHTQSKTVRAEAPLIGNTRPPQLTAARRFFTAQGSSRATREARALANAFGAGTDLFSSEIDRANVSGEQRALTDRASGADRDEEEKNAGFNRKWDQLDALTDLNLARNDIPQMLEENNAEDLTEKQVQALITGAMKDLFEGIDPDSDYGIAIAPGLLELEAKLLTVHRDQQLEKQQLEFRSKININVKQMFVDSVTPENKKGTFPYGYLMEETNAFFDSTNKKVAFWETIIDFGIRNGRPDIIADTPDRFPNGDFTGISDPKMAPQIRAAISSATKVAANMAKVKQDEVDKLLAAKRFDAMFAIYEARRRGEDVEPMLAQLKLIGGTDFNDITASKNFGDSQLDERESRSALLQLTAPLWLDIHSGAAGIATIFSAWEADVLGSGPQAEKLLDDMMSTARNVQSARERLGAKDVGFWRSELNKRYNQQMGGIFKAINPVMHRINIQANAFYLAKIAEGTPSMQAYHETSDRFDPAVKNLPDIEESEIGKRRPQSDFTSLEIVTSKKLKDVIEGKTSFSDAFAGVNPSIISDRVVEELASGNMSEADAEMLILRSQQ